MDLGNIAFLLDSLRKVKPGVRVELNSNGAAVWLGGYDPGGYPDREFRTLDALSEFLRTAIVEEATKQLQRRLAQQPEIAELERLAKL